METGPLHPLVKDYYQKCHFNTSLYLFLPMFNLWSQIKTKAFSSYILEWQERILWNFSTRWTSSKIWDSKWITVLSSGNPSGYPKMMANIHLAGGGESKIFEAGVEMIQTQVAMTIFCIVWSSCCPVIVLQLSMAQVTTTCTPVLARRTLHQHSPLTILSTTQRFRCR